jgi:anti-anti-sigma factor
MQLMNSLTDPDDANTLRVDTVKGEDIAWVVLQGEADISTLRDLEVALEHVELDDTRSVHLHVTELEFADAATIRRLTAFARQVRRAGHDVKTCGASPTLRKVAHLLHVHDDLGLA